MLYDSNLSEVEFRFPYLKVSPQWATAL